MSHSPPTVVLDSSNNEHESEYDSSSNISIITVDTENNHSVSSNNTIYSPVITDKSYNFEDVQSGPGFTITTQEEIDLHNNTVITTIFDSTHPEIYDPNIKQNLIQVIEEYDDEKDTTSLHSILVDEIKMYAEKIKCTDFQGKGSINDYANLFEAASKIANESKQIQLDIDIEGFNDFANAADDLSALFTEMTVKLQNVNIIDDSIFLQSVANAMQKIYNLSEVFGKFKKTIMTTTTIRIPKSAHETRIAMENVTGQMNCAMKYIHYFVSPGEEGLAAAELSSDEKNIINKAVDTIDSWNIICNHGVSIAMANNADIQYIQTTSNQLKQTTVTLKKSIDDLRSKLNSYKI
jgi:hypothetical protein